MSVELSQGMPVGALPRWALDGAQPGPQAGVPALDPAATARLLAELQSVLGEGNGPSRSRGLEGGARLPEPEQVFSPDELALLIGQWENTIKDQQLSVTKSNIAADRKERAAAHEATLRRIDEAAKKLGTSELLGKLALIGNLLGKVVSVVAAAAALVVATAIAVGATVGTAGAASPAAIAVVAIAAAGLAASVADCAVTVASTVSQAAGGPALGLDALASKIAEKLCEAMGADEQTARIIGAVAGVTTNLVIAGAMIALNIVGAVLSLGTSSAANAAAGAAQVGGAVMSSGAALTSAAASTASTAASTTSSVVNTVVQSAKVVSLLASIAAGVTTVAQGGLRIGKGVVDKEAAEAEAARLDIDALVRQIMARMQDDRERVKALVQELDEAMTRISGMVAGNAETRMRQARNLV